MADLANLAGQIYWRSPEWLWLLGAPPLAYLWQRLRRGRQLRRYADADLLPWLLPDMPRARRQPLHTLLSTLTAFPASSLALALAWSLLCIALAGPRLALERLGKAGTGKPEIMLALDLSRSMNAADIAPSRRQRAIIEVQALLRHLQRRFDTTRTANGLNSGPRLGLIVFAGHAHLLLPATADYAVVRYYLDTLASLQLPTRGSALLDALDVAAAHFGPTSSRRAIILVTDGDTGRTGPSEQVTENALLTRVRALARRHISVSTLGVGTAAGAGIPLSGGGWLHYRGQAVISHLHTRLLVRLAQAGGGRYSPVEDDAGDWRTLYDAGLAAGLRSRASHHSQGQIVWRELYPAVLLAAIIVFFLATLPCLPAWPRRRIGTQHTTRSARETGAGASPPSPGRTLLLCAMGVVLTAGLLTPPPAVAGDPAAYAAYRHHRYATARVLYRQQRGYQARLGEGDSLYRLTRYAPAIRQFTLAVLAARTDAQRAIALFNLGNSHFQLGDYVRAANAFRNALRYQAGQAAARHNLALSKALQRRVEQGLSPPGMAGRMGSGPRLARVPVGTDVTPRGRLAIGESTSHTPRQGDTGALGGLSSGQIDALVRRSLARTHLAGGTATTLPAGHAADIDAAALRAEATLARGQGNATAGAQAQTARLWTQIFERETGFPAPLTHPRTLPGVPPW